MMTYGSLTNSEFNKISQFIYSEFGIKMPMVKKTMLEGRLNKRLRELTIPNYAQYCEYLFSKTGQKEEVVHMIDVVTTNKTDFYREPAHFDFLMQAGLPDLIQCNPGRPQLRIWSAGCSSGEEPYTISMVMQEYAALAGNTFDYSILGTDISGQILTKANTAVYGEDRVADLPLSVKRKFFLKSKDPNLKQVKVVPEIRNKVSFQRLNFMDCSYEVNLNFDIIFCRNVLIYFDKQTQTNVINKLCRKLKPGGYFFLGHSESITEMDVPLQQVKPTIFRRK